MFAAMQLQPYDDGNFKEFHSVSLKMCKQMSDILEKEEPSRRDLEEIDELLNQWTRHVESCVAVAQVWFDFFIFIFLTDFRATYIFSEMVFVKPGFPCF